jgi:hypothetical protein
MTHATPIPRDPQREQSAGDFLARVHGADELHAATLALLLPPASQRAARAWQIETADMPHTETLLAHVQHVPAAARLPWFETLVSRVRDQPVAARQRLLESTRRLMSARGTVRPIDRLHWLEMRERLGGPTATAAPAAAADDLSRLPQADVAAIARYTAFLSRMVPVDAAGSPDIATDGTPGMAWYDAVMQPWRRRAEVPACQPPDIDGVVQALQELQSMAWMQRPMLVRGWVVAAKEHSLHHRLGDLAADALRMTCSLLDSPMPPELARHYGALPDGAP